MLLRLAIRVRDIVAARSYKLLHEGIERKHLCCSIKKLIRDQCRNGCSLEISRNGVLDQRHILWNLHGYEFCSSFNLIEVLHGTLCVGQVTKYLFLYLMHAFHGQCHRSLRGNNLLLRLLTFLEQILEHLRLRQYGSSQCRVRLLGSASQGKASDKGKT